MEPPDIDLTSPFAHVYWNNNLMTEIIKNVERFEDRDALELSTARLRQIALTTPISRSNGYKVCMEYENAKYGYSRSHPQHRRFTIKPCDESSVEENDSRIELRDSRVQCCAEEDVLFARIQKRMPKSIVEFELANQALSHQLLTHLEKLPNLKRFVFRCTEMRPDPWKFELPDPQFVASHVESLALTLDWRNNDRIEDFKCMIGPGLKHFAICIPPTIRPQWFVEEVIVELAVHNVQLDTCQLLFPDIHLATRLITSMVHSIAERTQVMHVSVACPGGVQLTHNVKPAVIIKFDGKYDTLLKALHETCPQIFRKAEILKVFNLSKEGLEYLISALGKCYSLRELTISCGPKKYHKFLIDPALEVLPSSIQHLTLAHCHFSDSSSHFLTSRLAKSLESLTLRENSNFYKEKNFTEMLREMTELKSFEIDMHISPLSFPKIAAHRKLERFVAIPAGEPTEKALQILRFKFQNVEIRKIARRRSILDVSNRRATDLKIADKR